MRVNYMLANQYTVCAQLNINKYDSIQLSLNPLNLNSLSNSNVGREKIKIILIKIGGSL